MYRDQAFSSMFEYAVEALHTPRSKHPWGVSPDEAYVRLRAAKVARDFPLVLQMLERNELHLTAISIRNSRTADNSAQPWPIQGAVHGDGSAA